MAFDFNTDFGSSFGDGTFALKGSRRRRSRRQPVGPAQQPDPSFLRSLGEGALGVAGAVGNVLDVPGSMVRDTLAGNNPFDQLLTPFSDKNRISGRDLARQYGLAGQKDTWGNFAGGLATEIATDPLTLLGVGFLGKTAKGAKLAKTGETAAKGLGEGIRAGERALVAGKVPFLKGSEWALGTGEKAAKVGDKLDKAYGAVRYSKPGRVAASIFSPEAMGHSEKSTQIAAKNIIYPEIQSSHKDTRHFMIDISNKLKNIGITDSDVLRAELEMKDLSRSTIHAKDPTIIPAIRRKLASELALDKHWGRPSASLDDMFAEYFPRYITPESGGSPVGKVWSGSSQTDRARKMALKDWVDGTDGVKELFKDQDLAEMSQWMEEHRRKMVRVSPVDEIPRIDKQFVDQMTNAIKQKYAGRFLPSFVDKGVEYDRARELAKAYLNASGVMRSEGVYNNNPVVDFFNKIVAGQTKRAKIKGLVSVLGEHVPAWMRGKFVGSGKTVTDPDKWAKMKIGKIKKYHPSPAGVGEGLNLEEVSGNPNIYSLFTGLKMDPKRAAGVLLRESGVGVNRRTMKAILETEIPTSIYEDLMRGPDRTILPKSIEKAMFPIDQYSNLFKAGVLTHPARHFRDAAGAWFQNLIHGVTRNPLSRWTDTGEVMAGGSVKGLLDHPEIKSWVKAQGLELNDKSATDAFRYLYAGEGPGSVFKHTDITGTVRPSTEQTISDVLGSVPGVDGKSSLERWKDIGRTILGKDGNASWNPKKWTTRGVNGRSESTFPLFAASDKLSEWTDHVNRLDPFLQLMRQGYSSRQAMDLVNSLQVNYNPSTFTAAEKQIFKRIFPFYSYTSRMTKHVGKELATNPGGGLANAIRAQRLATDKSGTTPDHVSQTASIPVQELPDGTKRYLTGLGLMHEDALQFMQPSLHNFALESASRLNPIAQKAIEGTTGQSLYFKGPDGTRPINELDPTIGRILANVTGAKDSIRYPGDSAVEALVGLSPLSRVATTVRQLTDNRKGPGAKALNTLTGFKLTDVSPAAQERTIKRRMEQKAKELGARTFSSIYFPKELTNDKQAAERIADYKRILKSLDGLSKKRKKNKESVK